MFLTAKCVNHVLFYCLGLFLFNVLDVEEERDRKNVLNMLAKAFLELERLFCLLWFNATVNRFFCNTNLNLYNV